MMGFETDRVASELAVDLAGRIGVPDKIDPELISHVADADFLPVHFKAVCGCDDVFEVDKEMPRQRRRLKNHLMSPRRGQDGLATPERVWVRSGEVTIRYFVEIDRGGALAVDDQQAAMRDDAQRYRFVVEREARGFLVLVRWIVRRKGLVEALDEGEVTVLHRGCGQARSRGGRILDLTDQFKEILVFRNADPHDVRVLGGRNGSHELPARQGCYEKVDNTDSCGTHVFSFCGSATSPAKISSPGYAWRNDSCPHCPAESMDGGWHVS